MLRTKKWLILALAVLGTGLGGASVDAHGRFFRWWFRPPAAAIADVAFTGEAEDGQVRTIVVVNNRVSSSTRNNLDDGTFTATVASGAITIDDISLTNATADVTVAVTFPNPANLARNFFNSTFFAEGTATITTTAGTTTVPVFVFGVISEKDDEYRLRAEIRGLTSTDSGTGTVTYTQLKLELDAEVAVPTTTAT